MKTIITMRGGNATVEVFAENPQEDAKVLSVARYAESIGARTDMGKKSYKRQFYKECHICAENGIQRQVKGATGLAKHISYKHKDAKEKTEADPK